MAVDGDGAGSVPAAGVVADEVSVIVPARLDADGVLELCDEGDAAEGLPARLVLAEDACGGNAVDAWGETLKGERVLAGAARKDEAGAVFEADGVRDLGFQGSNVGGLGLVGASD